MPYYDYRCPSCGVFEQRRPMDQSDSAECPKCKQSSARMLSAPHIGSTSGGSAYEAAPACGGMGMMGGGCGMGGCGHAH